MVTTNDTRVDTTYIGYLLIGFVLLLFGVYGLIGADMFGDLYKDKPLDYIVFGMLCGIIGVILIILALLAYRTGKKLSAGIFVFFAVLMAAKYLDGKVKYGDYIAANSDWFLYLAIAIFFAVFAIYAFVDKAPKFVTILLLLISIMTFFICLCGLNGNWAQDNDDLFKAFSICYMIFAFLGFIVSTYIGLALASPKKIPLI